MRLRLFHALMVCVLLLAGFGAATQLRAAESPDFARDVLPLLSDHCFACHGPDAGSRKGGLRLDMRDGALGAGKSGTPAVVAGAPERSEVWRRVTSLDADEQMPPPESAKRSLSAAEKAMLQRWIAAGAPWGRHWAYDAPRRPAPDLPRARALRERVRNGIDALVFRRLEQEGVSPAPEASRTALIRRVSLDLTGLPPGPGDLRALEGDPSPDAYERWVDRLLASPRYGERMAWEWLEAARYADSNGYQGDGERTMWPWRDWVVAALNRNLPFDTFSTWQLAGDLLPGATFEQRLATGFLRNHMINGEGGRIPEENRIEYLFDQTETVGTVWLAATFNCARCHDHKYDPLPQRDYYGLLAYFNQTPVDGSGGDPQMRPHLEAPSPEQAARLEMAERRWQDAVREVADFEFARFGDAREKPAVATESLAAADAPVPAEIRELLKVAPRDRDAGKLEKLASHWRASETAYAELLRRLGAARQERDAAVRGVPRVMVMAERAEPRDTFVLNRGLYNQPQAKVTAGVPLGLAGIEAAAAAEAEAKAEARAMPTDRLGLARWLMANDQPLTARVTVNRAWQSIFGVGLVKTAEDFGLQGERPLHAELLDWLACELVDSGWDLKRLHRLMVTSSVYRQSSVARREEIERDPDNRLLARGPRHRLPSWMIRDVALSVAGLLTGDVGGAPVRPYQPEGVWEEATFGAKRYVRDAGAALYRRSVYVFWRRIVGPTLFFDVASRQTCTVKTPRTNVPLHALLTLNDTTYVEAARALAFRVLGEAPAGDASRIDWLYHQVLSRPAEMREVRLLEAALSRHRAAFAADATAAEALLRVGEWQPAGGLDALEAAAWTLLCSTVLNLDEALTRE